jgi:hypothetical protein
MLPSKEDKYFNSILFIHSKVPRIKSHLSDARTCTPKITSPPN